MADKCAHCWAEVEVRCKKCGGWTVDLDDEYGSLSDGGSFERFRCAEPMAPECRDVIYVELPD